MVGTTIIPETVKFTLNNKVGMYKYPKCIAVGNYGFFYLLCGEQDQKNKIYEIQLHNPITKITCVMENIFETQMVYFNGTLLLCGSNGTIKAIQVREKKSLLKYSNKKDLVKAAAEYGLQLDLNSTLMLLKDRCVQFLDDIKDKYTLKGMHFYYLTLKLFSINHISINRSLKRTNYICFFNILYH